MLTELLVVFVEAVFVEPHRPKLHPPPPVPLLLPLPFMFSFLLLPAMPLILSFFFRAAVMRNFRYVSLCWGWYYKTGSTSTVQFSSVQFSFSYCGISSAQSQSQSRSSSWCAGDPAHACISVCVPVCTWCIECSASVWARSVCMCVTMLEQAPSQTIQLVPKRYSTSRIGCSNSLWVRDVAVSWHLLMLVVTWLEPS